jgi:hypothetical protein
MMVDDASDCIEGSKRSPPSTCRQKVKQQSDVCVINVVFAMHCRDTKHGTAVVNDVVSHTSLSQPDLHGTSRHIIA